ncbi:unnamed protein product [Victoria cruziana]
MEKLPSSRVSSPSKPSMVDIAGRSRLCRRNHLRESLRRETSSLHSRDSRSRRQTPRGQAAILLGRPCSWKGMTQVFFYICQVKRRSFCQSTGFQSISAI